MPSMQSTLAPPNASAHAYCSLSSDHRPIDTRLSAFQQSASKHLQTSSSIAMQAAKLSTFHGLKATGTVKSMRAEALVLAAGRTSSVTRAARRQAVIEAK